MSGQTCDLEILSAYADGELSGPKARQLEEHISACPQCSALLEMYRETTVAIEESAAPVPDELCGGVMNKISETAPLSADSATEPAPKRKKMPRIIFARYMPLAACLALALLLWGNWGSLFSLRNGATGGNPRDAVPAMVEVAESNVYVAADTDALEQKAEMADESVESYSEEPAADAAPAAAPRDAGGGSDESISAEAEESAGSYTKISAAEAIMFMSEADQYVILDVRTEDEYSKIRIKDAILIPHDEISTRVRTQIPDTDVIIFVYCQSGVRSALAAEELAQMGYTQVFDIGGIADWPYETEQ